MDIISRLRGRLTLALVLLGIIFILWPQQSYINAPARLEPAAHSDIFAPLSAHLVKIHVETDNIVKAGDILFELHAPALEFATAQSRARLALLDAQLARSSSNLAERRSGSLLNDERRREQARLDGLIAQRRELKIYAPQAGRVSGLTPRLHEGRVIQAAQPLARISSLQSAALLALAPEQDAAKIKAGAPVKFIADDPAFPALKSQLKQLAPTARAQISEAELTSQFGGKIAVHPEDQDGFIPVSPVYEVKADMTPSSAYLGRTVIGVARIKAQRQSYASRIGRQILRVLIREGDF